MNRFLAELKRRRVIRAALVYMGAAFVVLQVADLFVEAFQLPPVVFATFGIAAIVGLPVAVILAWAFDVGPPDKDQDGDADSRSGQWVTGRSLIAVVVLVTAGVLIGLAPQHLLDQSGEPSDTAVRRYEILLPEHAPIEFIGSSPLSVPTLAMAITPDGNRLIYAGSDEAHGTRLYVRDLGEFEVRPLPGSEGAYAPFVSPDGRSVGFFANDQLRIVPINGGNARIVAETPNPLGGAWWGPDRIIFNDRESRAHWWAPLIGGLPTPLPVDQSQAPPGGVVGLGQEYHPLPDGDRFLVNTSIGPVAAYSPATGALQTVIDIPVNVRVASDTLVYAIANDLLAVDFDPASASLSGDERTVGSGLRRDGSIAQFVLSDRTLIYATGAPYGQRRLALVSRDGSTEEVGIPAARFVGAAFSPDGKRLAIAVVENQVNIWI
jgi:serine/threonine-protein kinase